MGLGAGGGRRNGAGGATAMRPWCAATLRAGGGCRSGDAHGSGSRGRSDGTRPAADGEPAVVVGPGKDTGCRVAAGARGGRENHEREGD